jgi:hypothetical protein
MPAVRITVRDESHLQAHEHELNLSREEAFDLIARELDARPGSGEVRRSVRCRRVVGTGGLKRVRPWSNASYWDYREGRSIPSHLVVARRRRTRHLCFWGRWIDGVTFEVHTYYPGKVAPREIHDPEIALEELKRSVRFWARHAIVSEHIARPCNT